MRGLTEGLNKLVGSPSYFRMKTLIPGTASPEYLAAYRQTQVDFFNSITESPETTARYEAAEAAYREANLKRIKRATKDSEYPRTDFP